MAGVERVGARSGTKGGSPIVLSLTGEPIGELTAYRGDRIGVRIGREQVIWLSAECIYLEHALYVELICHRKNLGRYLVDPP